MRVACVLLVLVIASLAARVARGAESVFSPDPPTKEAEAERWALVSNSMFAARYDRALALKLGGGSDRTEWAVILALRWLKLNQNEDGSWGEDPLKPAMTGFALMCFLGHGDDHMSAEFGRTVRAAVDWLVQAQDEEGYFTKQHRYAYQHGIATIAMAEAYGQMRIAALRLVVEAAVRPICAGQTDEGGWHYSYVTERPGWRDHDTGREHPAEKWLGGDTSVSGWQIQALNAAWYAGIRFADNALKNARMRAVGDITSRFDRETGCGYQGTQPTRTKEQNYATTAIGTMCLQTLGNGSSREARAGLKLMASYDCDWDTTTGGSFGPLYSWYYVTQAVYYAATDPRQSKQWQAWNRAIMPTLVLHQHKDGHWEYPAAECMENKTFKGKNEHLYSTALCCLILETYTRYGAGLPAYKRGAASR